MQVAEFVQLVEDTNQIQLLLKLLATPDYANKRVILSSDDLTGDETDKELDGIVSIRELVYG